jgi:hypothetical protein
MTPPDYLSRPRTDALRPGDAVLTVTYAHEAMRAHRVTDPTLPRARMAVRTVARIDDPRALSLTSSEQRDRLLTVVFTDGRRLTEWASARWLPAATPREV